MRHLLALTFSISLLCSVSAQKKAINIPHLWESYSFYPKMVPGFNFMNDGKTLYSTRKRINRSIRFDLWK